MDNNIRISLENQNPWWFHRSFDSGIPRLENFPAILRYMKTREILILVGARRSGKSTLLFQMIQSLIKDEDPESILFLNMDEPLFQTKSEEPELLNIIIQEYTASNNLKYVFIDEIQNYKYWS